MFFFSFINNFLNRAATARSVEGEEKKPFTLSIKDFLWFQFVLSWYLRTKDMFLCVYISYEPGRWRFNVCIGVCQWLASTMKLVNDAAGRRVPKCFFGSISVYICEHGRTHAHARNYIDSWFLTICVQWMFEALFTLFFFLVKSDDFRWTHRKYRYDFELI